MIRQFLGGVFGPYVVGALLAVLALQAVHGWRQGRQIAAAEARADRAERDLTTCRSNTLALDEARKRQNEAVEAAKAEGEAMVAESRKATSQARAVAESYRQQVQALLSRPKPAGDLCAAARALILEEAGR